MKAKFAYFVIVVLIIVLALSATACRLTGGGGVTGSNITATFGAQQFHLQQTAQAQIDAQGARP